MARYFPIFPINLELKYLRCREKFTTVQAKNIGLWTVQDVNTHKISYWLMLKINWKKNGNYSMLLKTYELKSSYKHPKRHF